MKTPAPDYDRDACRSLVVRLMWDALVDYVRDFDGAHQDAAAFFFTQSGRDYLEMLQIDSDAALEAISGRRNRSLRIQGSSAASSRSSHIQGFSSCP